MTDILPGTVGKRRLGLKQGGGKGEFGEQALAFGACGETHRRGGPASLSTQRPGIWLEFVSAVFSKFCDKKIVLLCL